jgi:Ca-activated chloride channel homolog
MRNGRIFIAALALFFCGAIRVEQAAPQDKPADKTSKNQSPEQKPEGREINIRMPDTDLVSLSVTVTDGFDRMMTGLRKEDFELFEGNIKQPISHFSEEDIPLNVGIVLDVSGSMKGKFDRARDALKAFIQTSHSDDDFFLIVFNQRAQMLAEGEDGDSLIKKLTLIEISGQTALYDAAYLAIEKVKQGRHNRHAMLLISDGQDNSSRYTFDELRKLLKEAGVQIYCIGIAEMGGAAGGTLDMQGQARLEEIAQVTGGKAFFPRSAAELEDLTSRIAVELRHQYSIGYTSTNANRDGQWRKIKVTVVSKKWSNLRVRHKEGYYSATSSVGR